MSQENEFKAANTAIGSSVVERKLVAKLGVNSPLNFQSKLTIVAESFALFQLSGTCILILKLLLLDVSSVSSVLASDVCITFAPDDRNTLFVNTSSKMISNFLLFLVMNI